MSQTDLVPLSLTSIPSLQLKQAESNCETPAEAEDQHSVCLEHGQLPGWLYCAASGTGRQERMSPSSTWCPILN